MEAYGNSQRVSAAVAVLGGASLLFGESVVLFLNQVRRLRFVLSLALNGVLFALTLALWSATIWLVAAYGLGARQPLPSVVVLVGLGAAPFAFGFLVLAPHIGPAIARILWVWSLLLIVRAVALAFEISLLEASTCVGVGWVLVLLLGRTLGRPVVRARNALWTRVAGPRTRLSAQDILAEALEATSRAGEPEGGP